FSFNMFDHPIPRVFQNRFSTQYRCFSVSMLAGPNDRSDVEKGGKIIMPPSALDQLSRLNITYPMLFKLTNKNSDRMTHCGVLEFVADEGICYLPHWMMQNLLLEEGGLVQVESVNLQVATYSKFQPQSPDFLDITNPKAVYPSCIYELRVMETKPDKAVSIIECDMNVDFDAPLGYKEPERSAQHEEATDVEADHSGYVSDIGFRVSPLFLLVPKCCKMVRESCFKQLQSTNICNNLFSPPSFSQDESGSRFIAFSGEGQSLRKKGRKP
ncbi:UFD1 protein, partial [Calyptomena viridis]|nr:UFD1 protein [Calyptomena viridis]